MGRKRNIVNDLEDNMENIFDSFVSDVVGSPYSKSSNPSKNSSRMLRDESSPNYDSSGNNLNSNYHRSMIIPGDDGISQSKNVRVIRTKKIVTIKNNDPNTAKGSVQYTGYHRSNGDVKMVSGGMAFDRSKTLLPGNTMNAEEYYDDYQPRQNSYDSRQQQLDYSRRNTGREEETDEYEKLYGRRKNYQSLDYQKSYGGENDDYGIQEYSRNQLVRREEGSRQLVAKMFEDDYDVPVKQSSKHGSKKNPYGLPHNSKNTKQLPGPKTNRYEFDSPYPTKSYGHQFKFNYHSDQPDHYNKKGGSKGSGGKKSSDDLVTYYGRKR